MGVSLLGLRRGDRVTIERDQCEPTTYVVEDLGYTSLGGSGEPPDTVILKLRVDDEGGPADSGAWQDLGVLF